MHNSESLHQSLNMEGLSWFGVADFVEIDENYKRKKSTEKYFQIAIHHVPSGK